MKVLDDVNTLLGKNNKPREASSPTVKQKILIVEDDPILQSMYRDKFTHEGFAVIQAENGKEGLEMANTHKPDIVILDLMMPVMNGKIMLDKLRAVPEYKSLPVIILTNAGSVDNIKETVTYNSANKFLVKSNVEIQDVVKEVRSLLWNPPGII